MELKNKLASIIESCVHEGQLATALSLANIAVANRSITHHEHIFLFELVDYKQHVLEKQLDTFESETKQIKSDLSLKTVEVIESDGTVSH